MIHVVLIAMPIFLTYTINWETNVNHVINDAIKEKNHDKGYKRKLALKFISGGGRWWFKYRLMAWFKHWIV